MFELIMQAGQSAGYTGSMITDIIVALGGGTAIVAGITAVYDGRNKWRQTDVTASMQLADSAHGREESQIDRIVGIMQESHARELKQLTKRITEKDVYIKQLQSDLARMLNERDKHKVAYAELRAHIDVIGLGEDSSEALEALAVADVAESMRTRAFRNPYDPEAHTPGVLKNG